VNRVYIINVLLFVVSQRWNEMFKANQDDEVVNILKSKYLQLTVNIKHIILFWL